MKLGYREAIHQMGETSHSIRVLVENVSAEQARWRPDAGAWSILEVVNHLYDEEREDFRVRLDIILHRPNDPWPPIDPQGWVSARDYNSRDLAQSLAGYLQEREKSIAWLESLDKPDLDTFVESRFGRMSAGDLFTAWVAHDLLHLRQLIELRYAYVRAGLAPYSPDYAGDF